jgi:hypothetical protein
VTSLLTEVEFTDRLAEKLKALPINLTLPAPLSILINYGEQEPQLTIRLEQIYEQYKEEPEKLDVLLTPFLTEIGWTVQPPKRTAREIAQDTVARMRDLTRTPFTEDEKPQDRQSPKGPLVYQDLVDRPEEHVIVQFVLLQENSQLAALHTGDILPCFPDLRDVAAVAVENLKRIVQRVGLTLAEFPVENFKTKPWVVGMRGNEHKDFLASMMLVKEVMQSLEQNIKAPEGLLAIAPAADQLLITENMDETSVCEMGLLAQFMKKQATQPVSNFIWRFHQGMLERVQTVDVTEKPSGSA